MTMEEVYEKLCNIDSEVDAMMCDVINESEGVRKGTKLDAWLECQYIAVDSIRQKVWELIDLVKGECK